MGDFIVTLPVLAALRRQFPETRVAVVAASGPASLAVAGGLADQARSIESRGLAGYFARRGELDPGWAEFFAGFNVIFSYLYDPDEFFQKNVCSVTKAQFIQGPHRPDESAEIHVTDQFLTPLQRLGIFDADPQPRLAMGSPPAAPFAPEVELALHPGSSSERKNWPETRWIELLRELAATTTWQFFLLGGEVEGERLQRLAAHLPEHRREVWSHRPLPELATRMARSTAFLGHDTGPGHLAAALGLPGLTLWGETNAKVWRPRSPLFQVLHAGANLADLPATSVRARLLQLLTRTP